MDKKRRRQAYNREWRAKNKAKFAAVKRRWNQANKERIREVSRRWYLKNLERQRKHAREYAKRNKERFRESHCAANKKYRKNHPEKIKAYCVRNAEKARVRASKWYYENLERAGNSRRQYYKKNRAKIAAKAKKYYAANAAEIYRRIRTYVLAHPKKKLRWQKTWYDKKGHKTNAAYRKRNWEHLKPMYRVWCGNRRALKKGASIGDTKAIAALYRQVASAKIVKCHWCRKAIPKKKRNIDHVIPLSKGGAHSRENLVAACQRCNFSKGNKLPHEFTGEHELF